MSQNNSTWQMYNSSGHRLVWLDQQPARMDPKFKKEWLAALRSGEYEQGSGSLCTVPSKFSEDKNLKYCCLGVAGDLKVKSNPEKYSWVELDDEFRKAISILNDDKQTEEDNTLLPAAAAKDMGLVLNQVILIDGSFVDWQVVDDLSNDPDDNRVDSGLLTLAELNDNGFTFDQIADLIEYFL